MGAWVSGGPAAGAMFERFTDRARRVVVLAQEESRLLSHDYIGTEHLLLALVHEGEGVAAKALERLGVALDDVRERVREMVGTGGSAPTGHIPFTPRAKKVLELSLREALQLGHNYIGTEHVLLGLVREGEGVAARVLSGMGVDLSGVRQEVVQLLSGHSRPATGTERKEPARTPAAARAQAEARRLAGPAPVSTDHLLRGLVRDPESLATRALGALGVTPTVLEDALAGLDPAGSTDELPEEAGARRLRVEVRHDGVAVVLEDESLRDRLTAAAGGAPVTVRSGGPAGASFPALWLDVTRHLAGVVAGLEQEAAARWRPPEWQLPWDVAAFAAVFGPGGMSTPLAVAEGVDGDATRAALGRWLTDHQHRPMGRFTYLAVLVNRAEGGDDLRYDVHFGNRPEWPRTEAQYLLAHAILDLTGEAEGRRDA